MIQQLRLRYQQFHASFHDSEVILWARLQFLFFAIYTGLQGADMSAFISDRRLLQLYLIANGVIGEYARRRRAKWDDK
jgi:hypothetical protein